MVDYFLACFRVYRFPPAFAITFTGLDSSSRFAISFSVGSGPGPFDRVRPRPAFPAESKCHGIQKPKQTHRWPFDLHPRRCPF